MFDWPVCSVGPWTLLPKQFYRTLRYARPEDGGARGLASSLLVITLHASWSSWSSRPTYNRSNANTLDHHVSVAASTIFRFDSPHNVHTASFPYPFSTWYRGGELKPVTIKGTAQTRFQSEFTCHLLDPLWHFSLAMESEGRWLPSTIGGSFPTMSTNHADINAGVQNSVKEKQFSELRLQLILLGITSWSPSFPSTMGLSLWCLKVPSDSAQL